MDRFLSNATNNVDKKGRVSIPAPFRNLLEKRKENQLYTLLSIDQPTIDAGGTDLLLAYEKRMADFDPLASEYNDLSFYFHGDSAWLKIDVDGRVTLSEVMRAHAGITDRVAFVGRGTFFQMWQPEKFTDHRNDVRKRIQLMKQSLVRETADRNPADKRGRPA